MTNIKDKNILITGGARGIGKKLGRFCLEAGAAKIIIWDINQENLEKTQKEWTTAGYQVLTQIVDMSNSDTIYQAANQLLEQNQPVDILVNNAGIVAGKRFDQHSNEDIQKTIDINVSGVMHCTRAFMDHFNGKSAGHIVNIASAAAYTPTPNMVVYVGSKWAVLGWSESLRVELEKQKSNIKVTTICPSYINTGMFEGAKGPVLSPILDEDVAARNILTAIQGNKIIKRMPWGVNLLPIVRGLLPTRWYDKIIGKGFKVYTSMDEFMGHR
ncbi:MAG: SDR family NAD(P)-dependent oxidoreductase [Bacteroidota bacterium]